MKQPKLWAIALALSTLVIGCQSRRKVCRKQCVKVEQGNVEAAHIEFSMRFKSTLSTFRVCTRSPRCSNSSRNGGR